MLNLPRLRHRGSVFTKAMKKTVASTTNPVMFHIIEQTLIYGIIRVKKGILQGGCVDSKNVLCRSRTVCREEGKNHVYDTIYKVNNVKLPLKKLLK